MKKIAFFVQLMLCGGVENALISIAKYLYLQGNQVEIFVIKRKGNFIDRVPEGVILREIPMPERTRKWIPVGGTKISVRECIASYQYIKAVKFLIMHMFGKNKFAELNVDFEKIPCMTEHFDIAVNYHIHSPFLVRYLAEKVEADKKFTWIHNDFFTSGYDIGALKQFLVCCDHFFGVSQQLVDEFSEIFPKYKEITSVAANIVPVDEIKKKAEQFFPKEYLNVRETELILLTVGRVEEQKGFDLAIEVCKKMREQEFCFQWFVLGDGTLRAKFERQVQELKLADTMHFLGIRENPYPYFKNCDIYIQTSYHEGYMITVAEARTFCLPIICTDVAGAREQLVDGTSGDIVKCNVDDIADKLSRLIKEKGRREKYAANLIKNNTKDDFTYLEWFL